MKILKRILLVVVILIALICVTGFFFPASYHAERSLIIGRPVSQVYSYVSTIRNFNNWSPWYEKDTAANYTFNGPESGVGAEQKWESKVRDVGSGSMKIIAAEQDKKIHEELRFMDSGKPAYADFLFEAVGDSTKMTWTIDGDAGMNPIMRIMGKFMDSMVGPDFEKGLAKLKKVMESAPAASVWKAEPASVTPMVYLFVHDTATAADISAKIGANYGLIGAAMHKQKLQMAGPPMVFYLSNSQTNFEFNAAIPVDKPGKADGRVQTGELKAGSAAVVHYMGPYDKVAPAYEALVAWVKENKKQISGPFWEVYLTDPGMEKDTAKWKTDIFCPVL